MEFEFNLNSKLKTIDGDIEMKKEEKKQSESLNKFESSGNDIITGGAGLKRFTPNI